MIGKNGHKPKPRAALTLKQDRFCQAYVANGGNGTEAARTAGYKGSDNTLRVVASENLTKPNVKSFLTQLTAEADRVYGHSIMASMEALRMTSLLARASLDDILDVRGKFDLEKARRTGAIYAVRKLTFYRTGQIRSVELRDKNASIELMGKHHGLWSQDWEDPLDRLAELLKIPRGLLPAKFDPDELVDEAHSPA